MEYTLRDWHDGLMLEHGKWYLFIFFVWDYFLDICGLKGVCWGVLVDHMALFKEEWTDPPLVVTKCYEDISWIESLNSSLQMMWI